MKQILKEWKRFLQEASQTEIKYFGPAFQKLLANPSLAGNEDWLELNIGPNIGSGAFRRVFDIRIHPDKVLIVARLTHPEYTMHMNWQEKETFNKAPQWFPKVFLTSEEKIHQLDPVQYPNVDHRDVPGLSWIIVEKVEVINNDEEYELLLADNFPALEEAVGLAKVFLQANSPRAVKANPIQFERFINPRRFFDAIIKPHLGKDEFAFRPLTAEEPPSKNDIEELILSFLPFQPSTAVLQRFQQMAAKIWTILSSGKLAYLKELLNSLGIEERWDIRPGNVGKRGEQLLFIDIFKNPGKEAPFHWRLEE